MTFAEFKETFLPELLKIKSFKGKMDYANQHLQRIGSGTGRVVYDIDGEKILKLAKNPKGIAQNEAEAGAGYYRDTHHIVAVVFDSADDDSWLIAEKAKKVNEKRIIELTGIPNLNELVMYLKNFHSENNGKGKIFGQDPETIELLNNNEFAQDLQNFVADYSQQPGDYGRPSTYGEVLHDGQPSIVLTDYGLNDEVYDTHYAPKKERMYELYNFADGNDDILGDMPPQDAVDTRQAMWGLMPYSVSDGEGQEVINEKFVSFINNTNKYPTRRILPSTPSLMDEFHNVVNNLNEVLEKVSDKKKFYNNLLELQDYLIRGKFYDREPLQKEMIELDETNTPKLKPMQLDKNYSNGVAEKVAQKLNLGAPQYLGGGGFGHAYLINGNKVLKITTDVSEVDAGLKIQRAKPQALVAVYNIYKIVDTENDTSTYALIEEHIANKPIDEFFKYVSILNEIQPEPNIYGNLMIMLRKKKLDEYQELSQKILTENPNADIPQSDRQKAYNFMMGFLEIKKELMQLQIKSDDYSNLENVGYKDGILTYFDIGGSFNIMQEPQLPPENRIDLPEDGSARFSTVDSIGRDNFPAYNNTDDGSPLTDPNLPVNIFAEDLEYNHVAGDATQDKFQISERKMSYMPGSQSVEIKKKCRLGGLGNTSAQCNWGDINAVKMKPIDETANVNIPGKLSGYDSLKIIDGDQVVGEVGIMDRGIQGGNHYIAIDKIFIDKNFRGNGYANDAMNLIFDYADKNNIIVTLTPDNMWGASVPKLKAWYKSIGFIENKGKKKDFQTMQLMYRLPKGRVNEEIDASEAYWDSGVVRTMIQGRKDVGLLASKLYPDLYSIAEKYNFGLIPIKQSDHNLDMNIVYRKTPRGEANAKKLEQIMISHGGYVQDKTPEEAREIGKLLDYSDDSIQQFIDRIYKNAPKAPEYADYQELNEQTIKDFESQIHKDNNTHELDKFHLYDQDDFKVYAVNGEAVRDNGFDEWVDGGHHYVDADEKPEDQKYAKFIPEDEIWVDDVFLIKPNDLAAILLHERLERFLMKYYGLKYENAHTNFANPAEVIFRKKTKDGFDADVSDKIYNMFVNKFAKKHSMKKKLNESLIGESKIVIPDYDHMGWITPDNKFVESNPHIRYLWQIFPGIKDQRELYNKAFNNGYTRIIFDKGIIGNSLDIHAPTEERLKEILLDAYSSSLGGESQIYTDIGDEEHGKHYNFNLPTDKEELNNFLYSNKRVRSMIYEAQIMSLQDLPFNKEIEQLGGKIYSVGGAVRDEFLGKESKDLDVLITGVPMDQLEQVLSKYGRVDAVGKSFGVLKFKPEGATEQIDIAIPRTEKPSGAGGHQGFDVTSDHALPIEKDLERRDFTINAIARDAEGNLVDPFGGTKDLKDKIIRMANPEAFTDDPLRMLRAVQFASRFGFTIEPVTMKMIQETAERIKEIPAERILTELDKILNKGDMRVGAQLLKDTGLFQQIFGFDLEQSTIDRTPFESIKTMGEFIYLLTKLLPNPSAFYKTNLRGDIDTFKEIKALEMAFSNADISNPIMARSIASNMYLTSPKTLESQIVPEEIKTASQELLSGRYPKSINDLTVNGNDLMALGLQGKEIGDTLKMMLLKIYSDQIKNDKKELLSLVPKKTDINELYDYPKLRPEEIDTWTINGQQVKLSFFIEKYDIWNQGVVHDPSKQSVLRFLEDEFPEFLEDEHLKKELLWELTNRELLDEDNMRRVLYSAVVLDSGARFRLVERFKKYIPENYEIVAHHMTINMGKIDPEYEKYLGMSVELTVEDIAMDDKVVAVGVSGFGTKNAKAHITLAVNTLSGGKPKDSNNLMNWQKIRRPLLISGKVTEVTW